MPGPAFAAGRPDQDEPGAGDSLAGGACALGKGTSSTWHGTLADSRLAEQGGFYLSVRADMPPAQLLERFPAVCKIGAPEEVEALLSTASSGVP